MITPSFSLTATERVLPRMALNFTTASLDSRVTFTRTANSATVTNSSGVIAAINANLPRFDFNPTTLVCNGLLIEEARTNLLLNSLINGTNLSTQLVTTAAVAQTLSFYGTGQIVLTGTSSATVVGTGAYPTRTTLTFTPTVGVLTLTVTGTVQYAQLEVGPFATSFIPTAASQVTRNADNATMTGTNFSSWYNATQGAFVVEGSHTNDAVSFPRFYCAFGVAGADLIEVLTLQPSDNLYYQIKTATVTQAAGTLFNPYVGQNIKAAVAYKANSIAAAATNGTILTDNVATVPTLTTLRFGAAFDGSALLNGYLKTFSYYPQRLINAEVQAFSK